MIFDPKEIVGFRRDYPGSNGCVHRASSSSVMMMAAKVLESSASSSVVNVSLERPDVLSFHTTFVASPKLHV